MFLQAGSSPEAWLRLNIDELARKGIVTDADARVLREIAGALVAAERSRFTIETISSIRRAYETLCDGRGSVVGIALAAIALNSAETADTLSDLVNSTGRMLGGPATSDFGAGLIGAGAGVAGGLGGVLLGGLYGAAAGTIAWAIDDMNKDSSSASRHPSPRLDRIVVPRDPRRLAVAAGHLHGMLVRDQLHAFARAGYDLHTFATGQVRRLVELRLVAPEEADELRAVLEVVGARSDTGSPERFLRQSHGQIRAVFERALDGAWSPIAIMVLGVADNSTGNQLHRTLVGEAGAAAAKGGVAEKDVIGAIGGAATGGSVGGPWGGVIGGILGGGGYSFAQWLDNQNPNVS